jgi:hypothetical protein
MYSHRPDRQSSEPARRVEEIASGDWGIGGEILTADDVKALARSGATR